MWHPLAEFGLFDPIGCFDPRLLDPMGVSTREVSTDIVWHAKNGIR